MNISLRPGKYVVAVSGGVDSMVLLDMLATLPGLELTVAHFEHGIREDSDDDRQLVESAAQRYGLDFVYESGKLGVYASEAIAREARYAFLYRVMAQTGSRAITTAHHQDDVIETAIINLLRGTGRKGLSSLQSSSDIIRPLVHIRKLALYEYARAHKLHWTFDSTNNNDRYLRNYVRLHIMKSLGEAGRKLLLDYVQKAQAANPLIDIILLHQINAHTEEGRLDRRWFTLLPYDVSCETMAAWLRANSIRDFDRKTIDRLVVGAKVALPGKLININSVYSLKMARITLEITRGRLS